MLIEVFGPGCAKCETLIRHARHAAEQTGEVHEIRKVSDYAAMAERGILSTPALAIDGVIKSQGRVLESAEILDFLKGN
jgi:small redox-active disulfide protein 2